MPDTFLPEAPVPIIFLTGPSCTGKSTLCDYAARVRHWLVFDLDVWNANGFEVHGLLAPWERYRTTGQYRPLAEHLRERALQAGAPGVLLGFPSGYTPNARRILQMAPEIRVRYLAGPVAGCLEAFVRREQESGRGLPARWWIANNLGLRIQETDEALFDYLSSSVMRDYVIQAFEPDGARKSCETLFAQLTA